ncbi:MAG: glucose-6-phosphate dehydrogenase [Actinobacteria bacterium]|nr:glucose-6-phosphate dehydrogenase [Actinomycetota bacterium]
MTLEAPAPQAIVIFGASGDLARKKILPALYELSREGLLPERHVIIGYALSDWDDETFRDHAEAGIREFARAGYDEDVWKSFRDSLGFVRGGFDDPESLGRLAERLRDADGRHGTDGGRLYYLATPPSFFGSIARGLSEAGQTSESSRIVIEKPFGHDLESAKALTEEVHRAFDERQLFRIDHYLGKETVQNLVVFRFANSLFERVWNRDAIDHVQLTVAETYGVEGRAAYYEAAGATRDLLQNHMLQVLSFLTMEPPRSLEAEAFRDEKVKLLKTVRPIDPADVQRGQYAGYRDEPGVAPDSDTETFVAAKVFIDNWRWEGVPFYLRHGKRLPQRATEIVVVFRDAPDYLFRDTAMASLTPDHLTIRVQPHEGMSLAFQAKVPGAGIRAQTVKMDFDYEAAFGTEPAEAYERLIHDAMVGDHTLFTRSDGVERSWEIVTPALEHPSPLQPYEPDTWGPSATDDLIAPRHWHLGGDRA